MDSLNEEIDLILNNSLMIENVVQEAPTFSAGVESFRVKKDPNIRKIEDELRSDGEDLDLSQNALLFILKVFVKARQDYENNKASRSQGIKATKFIIKENYKRSSFYQVLSGHSESPLEMKKYLEAGGDEEEAEYRFKKIVYVGKKLGFLPTYRLEDFELREPEPEAEEPEEPEADPDTEPNDIPQSQDEPPGGARFVGGLRYVGSPPKRRRAVSESKLTTLKIDFTDLKKNNLQEGFLESFGGVIELVLKAMFGGTTLPIAFTGSENDVRSFAKTLGSEKSYIEAAKRYGLDHPATYKNRAKLTNSIKSFERQTGIRWPFK